MTINPKNGYIVAMASSADYGESKFNLAAQGHRQPGSTFKIMALMAALRRRRRPGPHDYVSKSPTKFNDPTYGADRRRDLLRLERGQHQPAQGDARLGQLRLHPAGARRRPRQGQAGRPGHGIRSKLNGYPAETLGGLTDGVSPLEMANAYATIASGGMRNRPTAITR